MKKTRNRLAATIVITALIAAGIACKTGPVSKTKAIDLKPAFADADLAARFSAYYEPVPVQITPSTPPYDLPLDSALVQNYNDVTPRFALSDSAFALIEKNGFVTAPWGQRDDVAQAYETIKDLEVPVFVTTDSVLHLYHIQFDETLREIEEKEFYPDMVELSKVFQAEFESRLKSSKGPAQDGYRKGLAYFSVGLKLLDPEAQVPAKVKELVDAELLLIDKHAGFEDSPVFAYKEDYSQYVPRGHYDRSETLKRYFKALMWYGRITMLIKGADEFGPDAHLAALVSAEEAQAQTIMAAAVAGLMSELKVGERSAAQAWERIYVVTAYYVGLADDLTPQDYRAAARAVFGDSFDPADLADTPTYRKFQAEVAKLPGLAIYSGTGESAVNVDFEPGRDVSPEQLNRILGKTQGLRFMGQCYIPDSFMLSQLVVPSVGPCSGPGGFTTVMIPDYGPVRAFPRGLDVMAVLGSDRALANLKELGDADYRDYDQRMKELRDKFGALTPADWNRNLYWSWLYALKGLTEPTAAPGWPTFMASDAWADKQLNAALGSWSSLRHDTILYAKQSYTPTITAESAEPEPPRGPVVGYVEPAPEFYARLVALTRMTVKGLGELQVLDDQSLARLQSLEALLARLTDISRRELLNQELTQDDYDFIKNFGERLTSIVTGASAKAMQTTLVADVHTDQNTKMVLEEATGNLRIILVVYKLPQGHLLMGAGPVYSYYEFKHPMADRLTDDKWRALLASPDAPPLPEWTATFAAP